MYALHETIKEIFNFPEWYGRNWSAFWDLLFAPEDYTVVHAKGYNLLPKVMAPYCVKLIGILEKMKQYYKHANTIQDHYRIIIS